MINTIFGEIGEEKSLVFVVDPEVILSVLLDPSCCP